MYNWFGRACNGFYNTNSFFYGGHIAMMIIGLLLIVGVLYLIFRKDSLLKSNKEGSPLELLQKRFVNGEINEDEYLSKKETIQSKR